MRLAPEVLVLELMREVFFEDFANGIGAKNLDPDKMDEKQRAILYALRGRRKKTKASDAQVFFAPAYPSLAESAWLRKSEARVINNFLLGGPIAQYLWHNGPYVEDKIREQLIIVNQIRRALLGNNSYFGGSPEGKEILASRAWEGSLRQFFQ